jgi:hypothetical protein
MTSRPGSPSVVADAALDVRHDVGGDQRAAKAGDPQQRCAPIGNDAEVVHEPAQRRLRLRERRRRHDQSAK